MVRTQWNREKKSMDVGFLKYQSRLVVPIKKCHIAEPELNEQLTQVSINPSRNNGVKYVLRKFPEHWTIPNDSFFQNNFFLLPGMVQVVRECQQNFGGQFLVDAYCGVGFFAIELASQVQEFVGVEIDRMAIKAARKNAADKGVSNGEFLEGATERLLPEIMRKFPAHQTTVVLDPPRRGIDPTAIDFLKSIAPGQIIYISCHPATQARDIAQFCADHQYSVKMIKPMDMFPQTQHIECVADLRLNQEMCV
jgi:tRNA/tmRNA/rRNA uracil-C5-methylase (TrmA/RlmC/RlmD family)